MPSWSLGTLSCSKMIVSYMQIAPRREEERNPGNRVRIHRVDAALQRGCCVALAGVVDETRRICHG